MKEMVTRAVVALAIVTGFTVTAQAQPVVHETVPVSMSITSTVSAVGVLAKDDKVNLPIPV